VRAGDQGESAFSGAGRMIEVGMTNEGEEPLGSAAWLSALLSEFDCQTGTLHRADGWLKRCHG
jgi:hypothetical protein